MNTKAKATGGGSPCGCGGGSSVARAAKCSCQGEGCTLCHDQGFVRPHFFAGQLLTEEDLQSMSDYIVSKNRLHNRYLFGEGVVCGLEVNCHPCGGGTVIVNPGYALDCCGNDILLPCPQELDINAMVRDLRRDLLGGYDCGDPCAEKKPPRPPTDTSGTNATGMTANDKSNETTPMAGVSKEAGRHYCLYIKYCEQLTDPVSPYATDDACGFQSCEPSRVREGISFELRCDEGHQQHEDLFSRVRQCWDDSTSSKKAELQAQLLSANAQRAALALAAMKRKAVSAYDEKAHEELLKATAELDKSQQLIPLPRQPAGSGAKAVEQSPSEEQVRSAMTATRAVTSLIARYYVSAASEKSPREPNNTSIAAPAGAPSASSGVGGNAVSAEEQKQAVLNARRVLETADERLRPYVDEKLPLLYEREEAYAVLATAASLSANEPGPEWAKGREAKLIAAGFYTSPKTQALSLEDLRELREKLLDLLDKSPHLTDCTLRQDVATVVMPESETSPEFVRAAETLSEALRRYRRGCICAALNPVCAPCDDTAVLLACLEVRDCQVVDICNLKRTFVISSPALRYWLPPLRLLGELLEKCCCGDPLCDDKSHQTATPYIGKGSLIGPATEFSSLKPHVMPSWYTTPDSVCTTIFRVISRLANWETQLKDSVQAQQMHKATAALEPFIKSFALREETEEDLSSAWNAEVRKAVDGAVQDLRKEQPSAFAPDEETVTKVADKRITAALNKARVASSVRTLKRENAELKKQFAELQERLQERLQKLEGQTP